MKKKDNQFILMNGDVLYPSELLSRLVSSPYETLLAVEVKSCGREEVKVIEGDRQQIVAIGKDLIEENCLGEFIGVAKLSKSFSNALFKSLDALIKAGRAIEKGEGLGGAIEAYNTEMKANQAAEVAKQEKEYDRERQADLDLLDKAVKLNEIAYKQSQMTTDDQKLAQDAAIAEARATILWVTPDLFINSPAKIKSGIATRIYPFNPTIISCEKRTRGVPNGSN